MICFCKKLLLMLIVNCLAMDLYSSTNDFPYEISRPSENTRNGFFLHQDILWVYGDFGLLEYTTDKGDSWGWTYLGMENSIKKMIVRDDVFYGVSDFNVFRSTDQGKTWQFTEIQSVGSESKIKDFAIADDKIYVPMDSVVKVYSFELEEQFLDNIYLQDSKAQGNIFFDGTKLNIFLENGLISQFNISSKQLTLIELSDFLACDSCTSLNYLHNGQDGNFFLKSNEKLFHSSDNGNGWLEIRDVKSNNILYENGKYYSLDFRSKVPYTRKGRNNEWIYDFYYWEYDNVNNPVSINLTDELLLVPFEIKFNNLIKLDKSSILAFGGNKTIVRSSNNGKTWEFVRMDLNENSKFSNFALSKIQENKIMRFFNDCVYIATDTNYNFKPMTKYVQGQQFNFFASRFSMDFDGNGFGRIGSTNDIEEQHFNFITNDYGSTWRLINRIGSMSGDAIYKEVERKQGKFTFFTKFFNQLEEKWMSTLTSFDDKLEVITNEVFKDNYFEDMFADSDNNLIGIMAVPGKYLGFIDGLRRYDHIYLKCVISKDDGKTWSNFLNDSVFIDMQQIWNISLNQSNNGKLRVLDLLKTRSISIGNIAYPNISKKYFFDFSSNIIDSVEVESYQKIFFTNEYDEKFLGSFVDSISQQSKHIYYTDSYKEPVSYDKRWDVSHLFYFWKDGRLDDLENFGDTHISFYNPSRNYSIPLISVRINDRVFTHPLVQNPQKTGDLIYHFRLRPKTPSSVEHSETETPRTRAFLHAGKPYPLPAVSTVSADLHWNAQYSAQEAVLKVFDSMGNEIPNANVELQQTNPYSGTVTWDCGTYPTGVYFIQVTIGTEQKNVGVAVVR